MNNQKYFIKYEYLLENDAKNDSNDEGGIYKKKGEIVSGGKDIKLKIEKLKRKIKGFKLLDIQKL